MRDVLTRGLATLTLLSLAVGAFTFNTVEMVPLGLLPDLASSFDLTPAQAGGFMSGYALVVAVGTIPLVRLASALPRKALVVGLLLGLATSTALFAGTASAEVAFASRMATAAAHGLAWSLMAPLAVAQFSTHLRGKVLSVMSIGGAAATVFGVPGATTLGAATGWRIGLAVLVLLAVASAAGVALGSTSSTTADLDDRQVTGGHRVAFVATIVAVLLTVTSVFVFMTYYTLVAAAWDVTTAETSIGLSTFGVAGLAGAVSAGRRLDRRPGRVLVTSAGTLVAGTTTLLVGPSSALTLTIGLALLGWGAIAVPVTCQHLLFDVSPVPVPMAIAVSSVAFNVGIAAGGALGGQVVGRAGLDALMSTSFLLAVAACAPVAVAARAAPHPPTAMPRATSPTT